MQMSNRTDWLKQAAAMAAAGAIVAFAASFTVAPNYVSTAAIQVAPQPDPLRPEPPEAVRQRAVDRVLAMQTDILSRVSLAEIIQKPSLDLYRADRSHIPMEDVVQVMRRDLRFQTDQSPQGGLNPIVLSISFAYPNRYKSQAVVRELLTKFTEENVIRNRNRASMYQNFWRHEAMIYRVQVPPQPPVGETVSVLAPASLPQSAVGPNRLGFLAVGLGAGLLLGLLVAFASRRARGIRWLAGFAAAGCVLAGTASFLIPDRYTSTAVLKFTSAEITEDPLAPAPPAPSAAAILQRMAPRVLSRGQIASIVTNPRINLYREERARQPLEDVVRNMIDRDIRIVPLPGSAGAFRISFSYTDRYKAQSVVRELVTALVETNVLDARANASQMSPTLRDIEMHKAGENLEVLDPASLPEAPVAPNRLLIGAAGLGVGLLLGVLMLWRRRPGGPELQPI